MRRLTLLVIFVALCGTLFAAHDFTINGQEEVWVTLGDSLTIEFAFETVGGVADIALVISAAGFEVPVYESTGGVLGDGAAPDETDLDGLFAMHLPANFSFPEAATIFITVRDGDVEDTVALHFEQLDSTFYLYGDVMQETGWMDLPVPAALVYTFYNASIEEITSLLEDFNLDAFLEWITQDHYVLSEMTGLLGGYELYVPDTIPNVSCTVGVFSMMDISGDMVGPEIQSVAVNGGTNVDFLYLEPDGYLEGEVTDSDGNIVTEAVLTLTQVDNPNFFQLVTVDSLGQFSKPLANGDYTLGALAMNYLPWSSDFTIADGDVWLDVELEVDSPAWVHLETTVSNLEGDPLEGAQLDMIWTEFPSVVFNDISGQNGLLELDVTVGTYDMEISIGDVTENLGTVVVNENTVLDPIVIDYQAADDNVAAFTNARLFPNPFNPTTTFRFSLAQPGQAALTVYDIRGRKVSTLHSGALPAGEHSFLWNGLDVNGAATGSGVYLFRLRTAQGDVVRKGVMLK